MSFLRIFALLLLSSSFFVLSGCSQPCQELTAQICNESKNTPKLCILAKESMVHNVSQRHCNALLSTWGVAGKAQIQSMSERYREYKESVELNIKELKIRRDKLDNADSKIRRAFRELLSFDKGVLVK